MNGQAYVDTLPWIVFIVVDRKTGLGVGWAGGCAAASGAVLVAWSYLHGRRAPTGWVALGLFGALFAVASVMGHSAERIDALARVGVVLALAATAFVTVPRKPLSEWYTEAYVAKAAQSDGRFRRLNVEITLAWGASAAAIALSFGMGVAFPSAVAVTLFNWVVPVLVGAVTTVWVTRLWEGFRTVADVDAVATDRTGQLPVGLLTLGELTRSEEAVIHRLPTTPSP